MHHRLAGRPFAGAAADPQLLDQAARPRRRIPARAGAAGDSFAEFVAHFRERGYIGANVTVPHKQAVLALSEPDERAKAVGAANCLWFDDGKLRSTNTDVDGFLSNLDAVTPGWDRGWRPRRYSAPVAARARWFTD